MEIQNSECSLMVQKDTERYTVRYEVHQNNGMALHVDRRWQQLEMQNSERGLMIQKD